MLRAAKPIYCSLVDDDYETPPPNEIAGSSSNFIVPSSEPLSIPTGIPQGLPENFSWTQVIRCALHKLNGPSKGQLFPPLTELERNLAHNIMDYVTIRIDDENQWWGGGRGSGGQKRKRTKKKKKEEYQTAEKNKKMKAGKRKQSSSVSERMNQQLQSIWDKIFETPKEVTRHEMILKKKKKKEEEEAENQKETKKAEKNNSKKSSSDREGVNDQPNKLTAEQNKAEKNKQSDEQPSKLTEQNNKAEKKQQKSCNATGRVNDLETERMVQKALNLFPTWYSQMKKKREEAKAPMNSSHQRFRSPISNRQHHPHQHIISRSGNILKTPSAYRSGVASTSYTNGINHQRGTNNSHSQVKSSVPNDIPVMAGVRPSHSQVKSSVPNNISVMAGVRPSHSQVKRLGPNIPVMAGVRPTSTPAINTASSTYGTSGLNCKERLKSKALGVKVNPYPYKKTNNKISEKQIVARTCKKIYRKSELIKDKLHSKALYSSQTHNNGVRISGNGSSRMYNMGSKPLPIKLNDPKNFIPIQSTTPYAATNNVDETALYI